MSVPHGDDAQRDLERRALLNVHTLAERLGASDKLDRRTEKTFAKWIAAIVGLVILALGVHMLVRPEDPRVQESKRCEVDKGVNVLFEKREAIKRDEPGITDAQLEMRATIMDPDVKAEAARRCARGF